MQQAKPKRSLAAFFGAQDMTVGKPWVNLATFSIPLLLGNIAQQLYSTVDSIVVGKYVGDNALAAVGSTMALINLLLVLFMGISVGATIMVSQYFGAKDTKKLSETVATTITLTFVASITIIILGLLITRPVLVLLDTPPEILEDAATYMYILLIGFLGCAYYNIISGILRGLGDSITPLIVLLICTALNIGLDLLFVAVFKMGVAGVAWATIIAQCISAVVLFIRTFTMKNLIQINAKMFIPHKELTMQVIRLGLPAGGSQMIFSLASIVVQSLTNSFGTQIMAVSVVVMRVDGFAMMPNFTFGTAMSTFVGQNIGAGKMDRVEKGTKASVWMGLIVAVVLTASILLFGRSLMSLFTDTKEVVDIGMKMMSILAVGYIAMSVTQILSGTMRGAGDTMTPMWISLLTTVVIRVPIAYALAYFTRTPAMPNGQPESLFISLLISWILGAVLSCIFYKIGKWRKKGLTQQAQNAATGEGEAQA